jgi:hypothetical protein
MRVPVHSLAGALHADFRIRGHHQTAVMGEALNPGRADLLRLAADVGLKAATAEVAIDEMLSQASELQHHVGNGAIRRATAKAIGQVVDKNIARCSQLPSAPKSTPISPGRRRPRKGALVADAGGGLS